MGNGVFSQKLKSVYDLPLAERLAYLDEYSRNNLQLREDYLNWLLEEDFSALTAQFGLFSDLEGYSIIKVLGNGSSSVVYLAKQQHPKRLVALKVLYQSHSEVEKRRFIREAEYLGLLKHTGIAAVYSAGEQQIAGQSICYIAMEYVDGYSLSEYVAKYKPSLEQRVRLIERICEALFHAHQRGILHRDIKPENIIVDGMSEVHLVDFGIGQKYVAGDEKETRLTERAQVLGTIAYMSPEQLTGGIASVGVQADIYSLGILSFEVLTGVPPFDISGLTLPQAVERVLSGERQAKLSRYLPDVDRDLEYVISKAMAVDLQRRYLTANDFALDLKSWLHGEPVQAGRTSSTYYLRQFIKRNKNLAATLAVLFVSALMAAVVAGVFAVKEANTRKVVEQEAERADVINQILVGILKSADPDQGYGQDLTVLTVVENAEPLVKDLSERRPLVGAELRITLAEVMTGLGELDRAEEIIDQTQALIPGAENTALTLRWEIAKAKILRLQGKQEEAERRLLAVRETAEKLPIQNVMRQAYIAELAGVKIKLGRTEAEQYLKQLLLATEGGDSQVQARYLEALHNLALLKRQTGKLSEAKPLIEKAVALRRELYGDEHPMTLYSLNLLGSVYSQSGDHEQAEKIYRQVLHARKKTYGERHGLVLNVQINLLNALISQGKLKQADELSQSLLDAFEGDMNISTDQKIFILNMRAYLLEDLGKLTEAERIYRRTLNLLEKGGKTTFVQNYAVENNLGMLLVRMQRWKEAEAAFLGVLNDMEKQKATEHYVYAITQNNLGDCLVKQGKTASGLEYLLPSHDVLIQRFGKEHARVKKSAKRIREAKLALGTRSM